LGGFGSTTVSRAAAAGQSIATSPRHTSWLADVLKRARRAYGSVARPSRALNILAGRSPRFPSPDTHMRVVESRAFHTQRFLCVFHCSPSTTQSHRSDLGVTAAAIPNGQCTRTKMTHLHTYGPGCPCRVPGARRASAVRRAANVTGPAASSCTVAQWCVSIVARGEATPIASAGSIAGPPAAVTLLAWANRQPTSRPAVTRQAKADVPTETNRKGHSPTRMNTRIGTMAAAS